MLPWSTLGAVVHGEDDQRIIAAGVAPIHHDVGQPRHDRFTRSGQRSRVRYAWELRQQLDDFLNSTADALRRRRTALVDIFSNCVQMPTCARRLAQPHRPNFFQVSAVS